MSRSTFRTAAVTLAAAGCVFGLSACHGKSDGGSGGGSNPTGSSTSGGTSSGGGTTVDVKDFSFQPASITIKPGTKVTWKFEDSADHNVQFNTPKIQSPDLANGKTYSYTFKNAGTYSYICGIHQYMTGKIVVK